MSSLRPPNNDSIQYPALPGTSSILAGTPNDNAITNSNAQGLVNDNLGRRPNNNADGISNNIIGGSSNTIANQASNETSSTTRQTRATTREAKVNLKSLYPIDELGSIDLREQQQYEIDRIIDGDLDETLGQFHHANKAAMT